jgi:uncharacterized protein (TIGR03437 family)
MVDRSPSTWRRRRSRLADRSAAAPSETACAGAQGARPCSTRSTPSAVAAFLIYAQDGQVNALVPFAVAGTTTTTIQAEFNGVKGNTVTIPVVSAAPGVFTQAYGPGQTWMVNSGGTFNSNNNPAARNTYVAFWATGQGLVNIPWKELCLLPCVCFVNAQTWVPRANFGARLEPEGVIMHGAGQDPVSYAGYWSAMPIGRQPSTFMGYVGLGTIAPN